LLAIYMGVGTAGHIQDRLLAAGIDPATPVTVVENGTLPGQKVATGSIGRLVETLIEVAIKGPAMIFVGAHPESAIRHRAAPARAARCPAQERPSSEELVT
jgi:uroporphyrin-III C-methyltransferase/precorrin-2 dehydrogenase/sirohydrochlorin ferrochelatase